MPQQTINEAKLAITAAQNARATEFAKQELSQAESALKTAIDQLNAQNAIQAKAFAARAKSLAQEAARKALEQKNSPAVTQPAKAEAAQKPGAVTTPSSAPYSGKSKKRGKPDSNIKP